MTGFSPQPTEVGDQRAEALRAGLADVRERVARACDAAGRDPAEVTVIVVTKFFPASDVRRLAALGVRDMGENRDQEASAKFADVKADTAGLRLHFIGQIQTNKAASVASYADVVHTVDRLKLVTALDRGAAAADRRLRVLVQVDLDPARPAATLGAVATAAASAAWRAARSVGPPRRDRLGEAPTRRTWGAWSPRCRPAPLSTFSVSWRSRPWASILAPRSAGSPTSPARCARSFPTPPGSPPG